MSGDVAYELRPATKDDGSFLYELKRAALRDSVVATYGEWNEVWQRERFFENFVPSTCEIVVVEGDDVGMLAVDRDADPIYVGGIYLLPGAQRRGIGHALMSDLMAFAADEGKGVHLQVLRGNPDAKRFYERLDFVAGEVSDTHTQMYWPSGRRV